MNTCKECGERMRSLGDGRLICGNLYDLALARLLAGDRRVVSHDSLKDDPPVERTIDGPRT